MPRAPPSSAPVSEMAEADPARSGGAAPTTRPVPRAMNGVRPANSSTDPATRKPGLRFAWASMTGPRTAKAAPALMSTAGWNLAARPDTHRATMVPLTALGNCHSPAAKGLKPKTSWRYCEVRALVARAHESRVLRADATTVDISLLIEQFGRSSLVDQFEDQGAEGRVGEAANARKRTIAIALDGLRAGHPPLPGPAPGADLLVGRWEYDPTR